MCLSLPWRFYVDQCHLNSVILSPALCWLPSLYSFLLGEIHFGSLLSFDLLRGMSKLAYQMHALIGCEFVWKCLEFSELLVHYIKSWHKCQDSLKSSTEPAVVVSLLSAYKHYSLRLFKNYNNNNRSAVIRRTTWLGVIHSGSLPSLLMPKVPAVLAYSRNKSQLI